MTRLASLLLLSVLGVSCARKTSGGVMLSMRTDLRVPLGVDVVGVYIQRVEGGASTTIAASEVRAEYTENGQKRVRLPGTLAVESDGSPDVGIRVRVVAYDSERTPVAMREARVTLPTDSLKALPLPLLWMNTDDVKDLDPAAGGPSAVDSLSRETGFLAADDSPAIDAFVRFRSDFCGEEWTLDDTGACRPIDLDVAELADYVAPLANLPDAEATAAESTDGGAHGFCAAGVAPDCFDLDGCFPRNETELNFQTLQVDAADVVGLDTSECSISLGAMSQLAGGVRARDVALAVEADPADGATCIEPGRCYIPLDAASGASLQAAQGRIVLPPGVCRKATRGKIIRIAASPLCARKGADQGVCTDATGTPARGRCKDGSGWNGQGDPLLVEADAGRDASSTCKALAQVTGFWVSDSYVTVVSENGEVSSFDTSQVSGTCLVGDARSSTPTGLAAAQRYRLLGKGNLIALTAARSAGSLATGALLTLPAVSATPPKLGVWSLPVGAWSAGAFFDTNPDGRFALEPVAAFQSPTELRFGAASGLQTPGTSISSRDGTEWSNLVSSMSGETPRIDELYSEASGTAALRSAFFAGGEPNASVAMGVWAFAPRAMARSTAGTLFALGVDAAQSQLAKVDVDDQMSTVTLLELGRVNGVAPPEATLAFAEAQGRTFVYFGSADTLNYLEVGEGSEGATPVRVTLPDATQVHAVQIVGESIYWLESNGSSSTLRRAALQDGKPLMP